jgi:hypothetical protein
MAQSIVRKGATTFGTNTLVFAGIGENGKAYVSMDSTGEEGYNSIGDLVKDERWQSYERKQ